MITRTITKKTKYVAVPLMALSLISSGLGFSPSRVSAFGGVGAAVSATKGAATGLPIWYQDTSGAGAIRLQPCLGVNADGTGAPDPKCILPTTNPIGAVAPGTFPDESFYWFAEAPLTVDGNAARFRMTLEAAFGGAGVALDGQQIVFARASLFTSQAAAFQPGNYTVTYPFGTFDFTVDALGAMTQPNFTSPFQPNGGGGNGAKEMRAEDGPGAALDFATVLTANGTGINKFFSNTSASAGYLGDGVTEAPSAGNTVTITGGPSVITGGTNWIVAGKMATADMTALTTAIADANTVATNAVVGNQVGEFAAADLATLQAAIGTASAITNLAFQETVDAAVTTLNTAVTTFQATANTVPAPADIAALTTARGIAQGLITAAAPESTTPGDHIIGSLATLQAALIAANATTADTQAVVDGQVATLNAAITTYNNAIVPVAVNDQAVADVVIAQIAALPATVALTDAPAITAARTAHDALTAAQKALVTNLAKLVTAEADIVTLQNAAGQAATDQAAADAVIAKITALPATLALTDAPAVTSARNAFNGLTAAQQALVTNASALTAAEGAIATLQGKTAAEVEQERLKKEKERRDEKRREEKKREEKKHDEKVKAEKKKKAAKKLAKKKVAEFQVFTTPQHKAAFNRVAAIKKTNPARFAAMAKAFKQYNTVSGKLNVRPSAEINMFRSFEGYSMYLKYAARIKK